MENIGLTVLVLLYGNDINSSKTLQTLFGTAIDLSMVRIVVWNNGPAKIESNIDAKIHFNCSNVEVVQTIENLPLSYIYNNLIDKYQSDYYVVLDDDSTLNDDYLNAIITNKKPVAVPIIYSHGEFRSPTVNGRFTEGPYQVDNKVIAIGSGICVSHKIAMLIKQYYGDVFDSRYAFYGVDTTFFLRLHSLGLSEQVVTIPGFTHSLSRLEKESNLISEFRKKERAYDIGLTIRHYYPSWISLMGLIKVFVKTFLGKISPFQLKIILKVYLSGVHPKVKTMPYYKI